MISDNQIHLIAEDIKKLATKYDEAFFSNVALRILVDAATSTLSKEEFLEHIALLYDHYKEYRKQHEQSKM